MDQDQGASVPDQATQAPPEAARASSPSGECPSRKCECDTEGALNPAYAGLYEPELELPYVDHAPGECRCTNDLAQYRTGDGTVRWLCSCCCTFGDERLAVSA